MATTPLYLKIKVDDELPAEWKVPRTTTLSYAGEHLILRVGVNKIRNSIKVTLETCDIKVTEFYDECEIWFPIADVQECILKDKPTITSEILDNLLDETECDI